MSVCLKDKVAIVTGASRGIGATVAKRLANLGATVIVNYNSNKEEADAVVKDITDNGAQAIAIQADISKLSDIAKLFEETILKYGQIDILINNAGLMINKKIWG